MIHSIVLQEWLGSHLSRSIGLPTVYRKTNVPFNFRCRYFSFSRSMYYGTVNLTKIQLFNKKKIALDGRTD